MLIRAASSSFLRRRVIALTPYLIMRPDKAPDEFPCGTLRKVDYRLARSWKDVAVGGSV